MRNKIRRRARRAFNAAMVSGETFQEHPAHRIHALNMETNTLKYRISAGKVVTIRRDKLGRIYVPTKLA